MYGRVKSRTPEVAHFGALQSVFAILFDMPMGIIPVVLFDLGSDQNHATPFSQILVSLAAPHHPTLFEIVAPQMCRS